MKTLYENFPLLDVAYLHFQDYSDSFDAMFSDVFPLWRDDTIIDDSNVEIDDEKRPKLFIPRK